MPFAVVRPHCRGQHGQKRDARRSEALTRLAGRFPHHTFFTLGYLSTLEPPPGGDARQRRGDRQRHGPALCGDAFKSAAGKEIRRRLDRWKNVAGEVYIWDYIQNFDDYLTPFPVLELTAPGGCGSTATGVSGACF